MKQAVKMTLRTRILSLRKQQTENFESSMLISGMIQNITKLMGDQSKPSVMAGYYPIKNELNILPILEHFRHLSWTIALPDTGPKYTPLKFREWENMDASKLVTGRYKIPVPSGAYVHPNILLVPLVGFTTECWRLGYGGGYYDKTIRHLKAIRKLRISIGIAYELQKCEIIPFEDSDEPLDAIVTERNAYY